MKKWQVADSGAKLYDGPDFYSWIYDEKALIDTNKDSKIPGIMLHKGHQFYGSSLLGEEGWTVEYGIWEGDEDEFKTLGFKRVPQKEDAMNRIEELKKDDWFDR